MNEIVLIGAFTILGGMFGVLRGVRSYYTCLFCSEANGKYYFCGKAICLGKTRSNVVALRNFCS